MKIHVIAAALASLCLVFIAACDGEAPSLDKAQEALQKVSDAAEKVSGILDNLDTEKVQELAKIAADIEKDPSKAEGLLKDAGISRSDFDAAVKKITSDPEMKKIFEAAKKLAE